MRVLLFLLLPLSFLSQTKVNVQILQKYNYCGGARPNAEILSQYEKPRPFANKKLVFVSANGKTCKAITNANGYLKIKLKVGSYKVQLIPLNFSKPLKPCFLHQPKIV